MTETRVVKSQRPRLAGRLVLLAISLAFTAALLEIALRVASYKPPLSSAWILGNPDRVVEEDLITIDRRFLREDFYQPYKDRGTAKLLVTLGDSFTASFPVRDADKYPSVLERVLGTNAFDVRVLNVGIGDTGPDQHLRLFTKYVLPRVKPDIVVWQFYPNDTYENAIKAVYTTGDGGRLEPISAKDNWMYRRQRFFDAVPLPVPIKRSSYLFNVILRWYERSLEAKVPPGQDTFEWGRHKIERGIAHMNELAAQHGFRVYYTLVAPEAAYKTDVPPGTAGPAEVIEYEKLLPLVQKQPGFINGRLGSGTAEELQFRGDLFADGSRDPAPYGARHLNETGYRFLAQRVANRVLRDNGFSLKASATAADVAAALRVPIGDPAARRFLRRGWQPDEPGADPPYVWSDGLLSVLEVPLPKGGDVRMDFECSPFAFQGSPPQTLSIVLNGRPVRQLTLYPSRWKYSVILPMAALGDWPDTIEMTYGYSRRPMDVISGALDTRSLAVVWNSIEFTPVR